MKNIFYETIESIFNSLQIILTHRQTIYMVDLKSLRVCVEIKKNNFSIFITKLYSNYFKYFLIIIFKKILFLLMVLIAMLK